MPKRNSPERARMLAERRAQYLRTKETSPVLIPLQATSRAELLELRKRSPHACYRPHTTATTDVRKTDESAKP